VDDEAGGGTNFSRRVLGQAEVFVLVFRLDVSNDQRVAEGGGHSSVVGGDRGPRECAGGGQLAAASADDTTNEMGRHYGELPFISYLDQRTSGLGLPATTQWMRTSSPTTAEASSGHLTRRGRSAKGKKRRRSRAKSDAFVS